MGGVHVYLHLFLTSVRDGGEWSVSGAGRCTLRLRSKLLYDTIRYPARRTLVGPQRRSERFEGETGLFSVPGVDWRVVCLVASTEKDSCVCIVCSCLSIISSSSQMSRGCAVARPHVTFQNSSHYSFYWLFSTHWSLYVKCNSRKILRSAHTAVVLCFVWISEQTAIISLYNINWLVFITETECVYCAVRNGYLNKIHDNFGA